MRDDRPPPGVQRVDFSATHQILAPIYLTLGILLFSPPQQTPYRSENPLPVEK
jgi:hypothetical protein